MFKIKYQKASVWARHAENAHPESKSSKFWKKKVFVIENEFTLCHRKAQVFFS